MKNWVVNVSTEAEREACLGKCKKVTLSEPVLGANAATMQCIGWDIDGPGKSLTFQTKEVLPNMTAFGSNYQWKNSTIESLSNTFSEKSSANNSIKQVTKLTNSQISNSFGMNFDPDVKTTSKGWIPSICEMGGVYGGGSGATSYKEWSEGGQTKAYQYYSSNAQRVKYVNVSGRTIDDPVVAEAYWTRTYCFVKFMLNDAICAIGTDGGPGLSYNVNEQLYLAPAFAIG